MKKIIASFDVDVQKGFTPLCSNELPVPDGYIIRLISFLGIKSIFLRNKQL